MGRQAFPATNIKSLSTLSFAEGVMWIDAPCRQTQAFVSQVLDAIEVLRMKTTETKISSTIFNRKVSFPINLK